MGKWLRYANIIGVAKDELKQQLDTPLYRNAVYLVLHLGITGVTGLVFWLLLAARLYSPNDVGLASATVSAMLLLTFFATLGFDYALIRFLPGSGERAVIMINSCLTIGGMAGTAFAVVFIAGIDTWSPALGFLRQDPLLFAAFVAFTGASTVYVILNRTFTALRRAGFALMQGVIFNASRLGLVALLVLVSAGSGIFVSWGLAWMIAVAGAFVFLPRAQIGYRPLPAMAKRVVSNMVRYSSTNYVASLLWSAPALVLPLIVVVRLGAEDNAYFYVALSIAQVLFSVPFAVSHALLAEGAHDEAGLHQHTRRSLLFTLAIVVPAILVIFLVGDHILGLAAPGYAEEGTAALHLLALSAIPLSLNQIYFGMRRVQMEMLGVICLTAALAIASLGLSWILLPRMGIEGVGVAWLSSQSTIAGVVIILWLFRARKRAVPVSVPRQHDS